MADRYGSGGNCRGRTFARCIKPPRLSRWSAGEMTQRDAQPAVCATRAEHCTLLHHSSPGQYARASPSRSHADPHLRPMRLSLLDWGIIAFYFLATLVIGLWSGRGAGKDTSEYFLS